MEYVFTEKQKTKVQKNKSSDSREKVFKSGAGHLPHYKKLESYALEIEIVIDAVGGRSQQRILVSLSGVCHYHVADLTDD